MTKAVKTMFRDWKGLSFQLAAWKSQTFVPGSVVTVDCERYSGDGMVFYDPDCPLDQLAVRLQNGNAWWYPIEKCRPK